VESSHNYEQIALSPDGNLLFAVNEGIVNIFKNKPKKTYILIIFPVPSWRSGFNQLSKQ